MTDDNERPWDAVSKEIKTPRPGALKGKAGEINLDGHLRVEEEVRPSGLVKSKITGNVPEGEEPIMAGRDKNDNRVRVNNTREYPYCADGLIHIKYPNSTDYYQGTGTAIDKTHILTAGHVVYDHDLGGFAIWVSFQPARNKLDIPYGKFYGARLITFKGWVDNESSDWDMGMIVLDKMLPTAIRCIDTKALEDDELENLDLTVAGYPIDKPGGNELWEATGAVVTVNSQLITYKAFTARGDSGAGVISDAKVKEIKHQYATHIGYVSEFPKTGCRITEVKKTELDKWIKKWT
jgi:V8-like Glu-specific endopeptidase